MYSSWISYPITRAYPYRWVTPLAIVGGIIAIAVVTFINVIVTGYDLVATYSNNPNETMAQGSQYGNKFLSYLTKKTNPTCASTTLQLNSEVFTTNYAIPYTLSNVWRENGDGSKENLGSLVYLNNQLLGCNVTKIVVLVQGVYTQSRLLTARSHVGLLLHTTATCAVESGPTYFELVGSYNLIDDRIPRFLLRNATSKASLYWGESLLRLYYLATAHTYYEAASEFWWGQNGTYDAYIELTRQSTAATGSADEVLGDEFFKVDCWTEANFCGNNTIPSLSEGKSVNGNADPYASIWNTVNFLGKAMWFTVMTDLGQNNSNIPNMLAYPTLLANLTSNMTNEVQAWDAAQAKGTVLNISDSSLETTPFNSSVVSQPALGAQPSFLSTDYICQVPRPQAMATRVFSILYADLILLMAIWQGFQVVLATLVNRNNPSSKYCEGCLENHNQNGSKPLSGAEAATVDARKSIFSWKSPKQAAVEVTRYTGISSSEQHLE
ncbi:hypothetical protein F5Y12DRAFT_768837 [Xylaria sp. FL1777]|nr:hypothetical protein F5Y12DRAFT_768837 [Xylaria sp. FL1777]